MSEPVPPIDAGDPPAEAPAPLGSAPAAQLAVSSCGQSPFAPNQLGTSTQQPSAADSHQPQPEDGEPCPTPLSWQQVVASVEQDSTSWSCTSAHGEWSGLSLGSGSPLYLLSDLPFPPELFSLTAWLLRDQFRCVTVNFDWGRSDLGPTQLGRQLNEIARELGDPSIDVYAAGFGCVPLMESLATEASPVRRAIVQSPPVKRSFSVVEKLAMRVGRFCPGRLSSVPLARRILQLNHVRWFPPYDHTRWQYLLDSAVSTPVRELAVRSRVLSQFDLTRIALPDPQRLLILRVEGESRLHREQAERFQQFLPTARVESLHTCGMLPYLTHPHRLNKLIRDFLLDGPEP